VGLLSDLLRLDGSARNSVSGVETGVTFLWKFYWLCSKWQIWAASVAQSVQWSLCGLNDSGVAFRFPAVAKYFYFLHNFNRVSGTWPASCSVGTMDSFGVGKEAGAWSCSLTYIQSQVEEWVELHSMCLYGMHRHNFPFKVRGPCIVIDSYNKSRTSMTNTYCVYTVLRHSWWWAMNLFETCRVLYQINSKNSASLWLLL
jgi:hypothetical protein